MIPSAKCFEENVIMLECTGSFPCAFIIVLPYCYNAERILRKWRKYNTSYNQNNVRESLHLHDILSDAEQLMKHVLQIELNRWWLVLRLLNFLFIGTGKAKFRKELAAVQNFVFF